MPQYEYQFSVIFTRNRADDLECAKARYPHITNERQLLMLQLRDELQESYDEGGMAGSFDIQPDTYKDLEGAP
ncbi:MAG: hypothetical protein OEW90_01825 [Betaproteobacteria bacterium]|nr:hypothetical protein [Betaproteobacteria bacterium]MDH4322858.1 hypothetical protein [Betaproteobacteria bacterium]MDH5210098.1 hypothetical protein [Betaproteobacteria bacterium]